MSFGVVPELSLRQRLRLAIAGQVFLRFQQPEGYRRAVAVYVVKCPVHGLFLDTPHGYDEHFECNDCLLEQKMEGCLNA